MSNPADEAAPAAAKAEKNTVAVTCAEGGGCDLVERHGVVVRKGETTMVTEAQARKLCADRDLHGQALVERVAN